jgi:hypothetical protein
MTRKSCASIIMPPAAKACPLTAATVGTGDASIAAEEADRVGQEGIRARRPGLAQPVEVEAVRVEFLVAAGGYEGGVAARAVDLVERAVHRGDEIGIEAILARVHAQDEDRAFSAQAHHGGGELRIRAAHESAAGRPRAVRSER